MNKEEPQLSRELGLFSAFCVVAGSVIGSGVFLVASDIARAVPNPVWGMWVWVAAGVFSMMGGLIFAELGSRFPGAGGQYVYFKEAFGPTVGFLFSWTHTLILLPGTLAALAVGFVKFLNPILPMSPVVMNLVATLAVFVFTSINLFGIKKGARVLDFMTLLKLLALLVLGAAGLLASRSGGFEVEAIGTPSGAQFGVALIAAFWAYDGWNGLSQVAGEIKQPQKNIPWSTGLGLGVVIVLYVLMHWAYVNVLGAGQLAGSEFVAADAAQGIWGSGARVFMGAMIVLSALGCLNAIVITGARVTYASAADGLFPKFLAYVHPKYRVPSAALIVQGLIAGCLVWTGSYDQLFTYVICAAFVFYGLTAVALIALRQRDLRKDVPFKVPAYPWMPLAYLGFCIWFDWNAFQEKPRESMIGFSIVLAGLPAYWILNRRIKDEPDLGSPVVSSWLPRGLTRFNPFIKKEPNNMGRSL